MSHCSWSITSTSPCRYTVLWSFSAAALISFYCPFLISSHYLQSITHIPQECYLPSVRAGASAVYVKRNLLFFQLRSLLIKESWAFSRLTSSPTQNTSQAALIWDKRFAPLFKASLHTYTGITKDLENDFLCVSKHLQNASLTAGVVFKEWKGFTYLIVVAQKTGKHINTKPNLGVDESIFKSELILKM